MSGKSSLQLSHFFPLAKRMGHQKLSTLRNISAPREYTPVIQSQYRHQIRSCPTRPLNFWRLTFTQSAWRYRGRPTSGVRLGETHSSDTRLPMETGVARGVTQ